MPEVLDTIRMDLDPEMPEVEIHQITTPGLGDHSYVLCSAGLAAVIDPQRDVDRIERVVAALGATVAVVAETHVHNDYVSGGRALAQSTGAVHLLPAKGGYRFEHQAAEDGDEVKVGLVSLRAIHTPGHTPHHMSYVVVSGDEERVVFSGGSVLVGACGRTDLISAELTEELTRLQYRSAQRIGSQPEATAVGPTHGRGSFCSASAGGSDTWTTVAKERLRNPAFLAPSEDSFVTGQLAGLLAYPAYYAKMANFNVEGAPPWRPRPPAALRPDEIVALQDEGVVVVDTRRREQAAAGHVPGSVNIELADPSFATYLGWLFPFGTRFALILDGGVLDDGVLDDGVLDGGVSTAGADDAVRQAARIGIETIEGVLDGGMGAWQRAGRPVRSYELTDVEGLHDAMEGGGVRVLDVRQDLEWQDGHVPGAVHVHLPDVAARLGELAGEGSPWYVICRTGHRASMAASVLDAAGVGAVLVDGGFPDWSSRGYAVAP